MTTLLIENGLYLVDGWQLEPGMSIRRYDPIAREWFLDEVCTVYGYDHEKQQRFPVLSLRVPGHAPSPLQAGDTVEMVSTAEEKDTAPLVRSRRIKRLVRIEEVNIPPSRLFDTTVEYPSDALPEWFRGLQSIVEDATFTEIHINLGGKVLYHLTIVEKRED